MSVELVKSWLIGKDSDAGKDRRQKEKATTEDEMVGWRHQLNGHEFEQAPGDSDGQGNLACCSSWGHKESDMTEQLNKRHKLLHVSFEEEPGPCPITALLLLDRPSYASASPPFLLWLASAWICPLWLREGQSGWMKPLSYNKKWGMEKGSEQAEGGERPNRVLLGFKTPSCVPGYFQSQPCHLNDILLLLLLFSH